MYCIGVSFILVVVPCQALMSQRELGCCAVVKSVRPVVAEKLSFCCAAVQR